MTKDQLDVLKVRYRVIAYPEGKKPVEFTSLCESINHREDERKFVATVDIILKNIKEPEQGWFHSNVKPLTPIILQAKEFGGNWDTIFNGIIIKWVTNAKDHTIELTAYDKLYRLLQSEEHFYFPEGTSANSAVGMVLSDQGIPYTRIEGLSNSLEKLICTGTIASTLEKIIEENDGVDFGKHILRADKNGKAEVIKRGGNSTVYELTDWGVGESSHEIDMQDIVTVVKVYSSNKGDERPPVKATHSRNTELGSIVNIIKDSETNEQGKANKEAMSLLDEKSKPKNIGRLSSVPDIPWVRKGDKIRIASGTVGSFANGKQVSKTYIVKSVSRDIVKRTMSLEVDA